MTFPAYEWTFWGSEEEQLEGGHRHVLFKHPGPPCFCDKKTMTSMNSVGGINTVDKLLQRLWGLDSVAIVHHSLWGRSQALFSWGTPDTPWIPVQGLAEIYSHHGCSEGSFDSPFPLHGSANGNGPLSVRASVRDAIAMGYRMGTIAGDDGHYGRPGALFGASGNDSMTYSRGGVTGFWSLDLTREGIWESILTRRVYGTTGARILLDFRVNGAWMGSSITSWGPPRIRVHAAHSRPLKSIEIYRDGLTKIENVAISGNEVDRVVVDATTQAGRDYSYDARVRLEGNPYAWSSSIWVHVTHPSPSGRGRTRENRP